jgi:hypothetical protein
MSRKSGPRPFSDEVMRGVRRKHLPHEFVLDALAPLAPVTRSMFGCQAVYVEEKIMLILRDNPSAQADNGVWIATTVQHHDTLRSEFPQMRSIRVLGKATTDWQVLPAGAPDFERAALHACALIRAGDPRIGKIPKRRIKPRTTPAVPKRSR